MWPAPSPTPSQTPRTAPEPVEVPSRASPSGKKPYDPPDLSDAVRAVPQSTLFLFLTFMLIFVMAATGQIVGALLKTDDAIFRDAIQIIGIGGPASQSIRSASEAVGRWKAAPR